MISCLHDRMMALIRSERNKLLTVDELHEIIQSISNDNISGEDKLWKPKGGQVLAMSVNPDSDPGELIVFTPVMSPSFPIALLRTLLHNYPLMVTPLGPASRHSNSSY